MISDKIRVKIASCIYEVCPFFRFINNLCGVKMYCEKIGILQWVAIMDA